MNQLMRQELWLQLRDQALVFGPLPKAHAPSSPWTIRVMMGVAGWIGALFLMGFLSIVFTAIVHSTTASLLTGALCCGAGYVIFRAMGENDFAQQFGLALCLAGQALMITGIFITFGKDVAMLCFTIFLLEILLAILIPNFIFRVLSSWGALIALSFALAELGLYGLAAGIAAAAFAIISLNALRWIAHAAVLRPIGYGLVLALLQLDAMSLIQSSIGLTKLHASSPWIGTMLVAAVFATVVWRLMAQAPLAAGSRGGLATIAATAMLLAVSFLAPGLATALLILLLGFASGNRILTGLGLIALAGFLSHYYYQLQTTLLVKSMVLAACGIVLLSARLMLKTWLAVHDEGNSNANP
jgi:hypothetical protein